MYPSKKILFLVPYPLRKAPSQRFRVELFLPIIKTEGLKFSVHPFIDERAWNILYQKGKFLSKAWAIFKGFSKRWIIVLFKVPYYDYIFIHREAAPLGPPVFEWIIARFYRKKIIYDFDDAIWIPNTSSANYFINWFKAFWKVKYICKWAYKITAGNDYLYNYARLFNENIIRIPTCLDVENGYLQSKEYSKKKVNVGWTGSHSTLKYLDEIVPIINDLQKDFDFNFLVIADKNPLLPVKNFQFIPWNISTEADDLLKLDIGVMPLMADAWSEGKCGFKLIQYFACGIPSVASPVGVNKVIVDEGVNGFLCSTNGDWILSLQKLLADKFLRQKMGAAGRKKIIEQYSIQSQATKFIQLFS
jgi:glycosyltransferase involved in cell wall biosynthesis